MYKEPCCLLRVFVSRRRDDFVLHMMETHSIKAAPVERYSSTCSHCEVGIVLHTPGLFGVLDEL